MEWLSDHGLIYTARETRVFASQPNLVHCFTPVASPGSSGMSEAFVKTLKRDQLRVNPMPTEAVLDQIAGWFGDHNENNPHSGLWMRSSRDASGGNPPAVSLVGPANVNRHDLVFAGTPSESEIAAAHVALPAAGHPPCRFHAVVLRDATKPLKFEIGRRLCAFRAHPIAHSDLTRSAIPI